MRVTLGLFDVPHDQAIYFYCDVLGLFAVKVDELSPSGERIVVMDHIDPTASFSILVRSGTILNDDLRSQRPRFWLELQHRDMTAVLERLQRSNSRCEVQPLPFGNACAALDPFGNIVRLTDEVY